MSYAETLAAIYAAPIVSRITRWEAGKMIRDYIMLSETAPASCKIWGEPTTGKIVCDFGRKSCSPAYSAVLDQFEALLVSMGGVVTRSYKGSADFTVTLAA